MDPLNRLKKKKDKIEKQYNEVNAKAKTIQDIEKVKLILTHDVGSAEIHAIGHKDGENLIAFLELTNLGKASKKRIVRLFDDVLRQEKAELKEMEAKIK